MNPYIFKNIFEYLIYLHLPILFSVYIWAGTWQRLYHTIHFQYDGSQNDSLHAAVYLSR